MTLMNKIDNILFKFHLTKPFTWDKLAAQQNISLYAGQLTPELKQYNTHIGLNPFPCSSRTIIHDLCEPFPLADNTVDIFQSEDVFEHIEYNLLPKIFDEIYRILKVGGLFRLSVPDYRFDVYKDRCQCNEQGNIIFDPQGGGQFINGQVVNGGHVWFPTLEQVLAIFNDSLFASHSDINILHGYSQSGEIFLNNIDYAKGFIKRTPDNDPRGANPYRPMSIVIDTIKLS